MVMRKSFLLFILFFLLFSAPASAIAPQDDLAWQQIVPGIEYQKYTLPDPNNVFVVRMDRSNTSLTLESTLGQGKLTYGRETVSGMFDRYDQALNNWGGGANQPAWGMRNQAVVGINGAYFDFFSGGPKGGQVQSGWYAKRFDDLGGGSGFGWKLDRSVFVGKCVFHRPEKQLITYLASGTTQQIAAVNTARGTDELVLFTPQYDSRTGTNSSGVEVEIEMDRPTMILPAPANAAGTVRQIHNGEGNTWIRFNSIVLSASGTAAQTLLQNVQVGSKVGISQEITSYEGDCKTLDPLNNWTKTYASIGSGYDFLKDGHIVDYPSDPNAIVRNPRTAIGFNDQYIFFLVVDGRDTDLSVGMSIHQLAVFVRDTLGATWGVSQDGGGSSTMVINGQVINNVHCNNSYVCITANLTYLPMVNRNGQYGQPASSEVFHSPLSDERAVANGMMMVIAQPAITSTTFLPADPVTTLVDTDVRLGPGTNYASITVVPKATQGSIVHNINGLDGVLAKSAYWWYVDFGVVTGWVPEGALVHQSLEVDASGRLIDR
jgi:hypothetical protein